MTSSGPLFDPKLQYNIMFGSGQSCDFRPFESSKSHSPGWFRSFDTPATLPYDAIEAKRVSILSIPHLIVIFVVTLLVFGPEKLPELARNLGRVMAEIRKATGDLRSTFDDHMRDLERETRELNSHVRDAARFPDTNSIMTPSIAEPAALPLPSGATASTIATIARAPDPQPEKPADGHTHSS
jgi:TatA/E family protein of Tat protein translocase